MKKINNFLYYSLSLIFFWPFALRAQILSGDVRDKSDINARDFRIGAGVDGGTYSVAQISETIIAAFLSILGVIFIILIILAGYNWMTASGDEGKVTKAKETLLRAVIGLLIIAGAYAITYFVFSNLPGSGGAGGGGTIIG